MNFIKSSIATIIFMSLFSVHCSAGNLDPQTNFEKGDLLITDGWGIFRHISILAGWNGDPPKDKAGRSQYLNSYQIIEENGTCATENGFFNLHPEGRLYCQYWGIFGVRVPMGIYRPGMTYDQRNRIIGWARSKLGVGYTYFPDHKMNRYDVQMGWLFFRIIHVEAYRCDGFCEAAYESVGIDPTPWFLDVSWFMTPVTFGVWGGMVGYHFDFGKGFQAIENQNLSGGPKLSTLTEDNELKLRVVEDKSGISLVEYWKWADASTLNIGDHWNADSPPAGAKCIGLDMNEYDYGHNYSLNGVGTGNIYARAYDQAGNFSTIKLSIDQLHGIGTANILENSSSEPPQVVIENMVDQDNVEANPKIEFSLIKKENPINYDQVCLTLDEQTPTYAIEVSRYKTASVSNKETVSFTLKDLVGKDLTNGIHTLKVMASDTNGNIGSQKVTIKVSSDLSVETVLNYPNPAGTAGTTFYYKLSTQAESGKIVIFNPSGKKVREISGIPSSLDKNELAYDCKDDNGEILANGVYFYFLELKSTDGKTIRQKGKLAIIK